MLEDFKDSLHQRNSGFESSDLKSPRPHFGWPRSDDSFSFAWSTSAALAGWPSAGAVSLGLASSSNFLRLALSSGCGVATSGSAAADGWVKRSRIFSACDGASRENSRTFD